MGGGDELNGSSMSHKIIIIKKKNKRDEKSVAFVRRNEAGVWHPDCQTVCLFSLCPSFFCVSMEERQKMMEASEARRQSPGSLSQLLREEKVSLISKNRRSVRADSCPSSF